MCVWDSTWWLRVLELPWAGGQVRCVSRMAPFESLSYFEEPIPIYGLYSLWQFISVPFFCVCLFSKSVFHRSHEKARTAGVQGCPRGRSCSVRSFEVTLASRR